ncbi:hypothetical protein C0Q70_05993 [Pomacea canaliculata]|uniref:Uncharacterized protein n=1 Tax=Pomacea canaliculata TaxID=400727 RepID=A0A2T7PMQ8_POMCA|nr:hypothetical protein C0Q70_05993 [Pomacea canaliculata]
MSLTPDKYCGERTNSAEVDPSFQQAYRRIRDLILENPVIRRDTSVQHADINQRTLTQCIHDISATADGAVSTTDGKEWTWNVGSGTLGSAERAASEYAKMASQVLHPLYRSWLAALPVTAPPLPFPGTPFLKSPPLQSFCNAEIMSSCPSEEHAISLSDEDVDTDDAMLNI